MNFLYDNIVHLLQNTIDSCINSATDRRGGYVFESMFTKFSGITQCNGHYAVQGHFKLTDFGTNQKPIGLYDFLLVINTNLRPILHRFQVGRSRLLSGRTPDCGARGPRFESHRGRSCLSRQSLRYTALGTGCSPLLQYLGRRQNEYQLRS